jgi:hypothetical protein
MLFLYAVFLLPVSAIKENVAESAYVIQNEGTYPKVTKYATSQLDNFTDSIMLLEGADDAEGTELERAVFIYHPLLVHQQSVRSYGVCVTVISGACHHCSR